MRRRNEELYEKSKDFIIAASNLLSEHVGRGEAVPWSLIEHISRIDDTLRFSLHPEAKFSGLVCGHREEVGKLAEYQSCYSAMLEHPTIRKFHSSEALGEILIDFLSEVVDEAGTLAFDLENFERVYGRIECDLLSETNHFTAMAPVCNFDFDGEEIHLGRGLRIRKATVGDLENLCGRRTTRGALLLEFPDDLVSTKYVLQITYAIPKLSLIEPPTERLGEVITALRLFKSGGVGFTHVTQNFPLTVWSGARVTQRRRQSQYAPAWGNRYHMRTSEIETFVDFWKAFKKVDGRLRKIPLRRFDTAVTQAENEDKLIDYMIALQALYQVSTGWKLSTRVATLLGRDVEDGLRILAFVQDAWNQRSKVEHGDTLKKSDRRQALEFISELDEIVRQSIKAFIALKPRYGNELGRYLDEIVLDEEKKKDLRSQLPTWCFV